MAKLELETRKQINDYYDKKLKIIDEEIATLKEHYKKEIFKKFEDDEIVKEIKQRFEILTNKYKNLSLCLDCRIYDSYKNIFNYFENEEIRNLNEKYKKLHNEKVKLILTLETYNKSSKEYQETMTSFIKKLENKE